MKRLRKTTALILSIVILLGIAPSLSASESSVSRANNALQQRTSLVTRRNDVSESSVAISYHTYDSLRVWKDDAAAQEDSIPSQLQSELSEAMLPELPKPSALSPSDKYHDISSWAYEEIEDADCLGLIPTALLGSNMQSPISRRLMCQIALSAYKRITSENVIRSTYSFSDTDEPMIEQAAALGIVTGYPDGAFRPDAPLTREEFFKILVNLMGSVGYPFTDTNAVSLSGFKDTSDLSHFAEPGTRVLTSLQIVRGCATQLLPQRLTTIEEAIALFMRSYRYLCNWYQSDTKSPLFGPAQDKANELVSLANSYLDYSYVYGGKDPAIGFDCSGFVWYLYDTYGVALNRTADAQWENGVEVTQEEMLPGDLVFFSWPITHVGIYLGNNRFIHAENSRTGVVITDLTESDYYSSRYLGARRIFY